MKAEYTSLTKLYEYIANSNARVISFDCFDTLFWRKMASPIDVFTVIDPSIDIVSRVQAEQRARAKKMINCGHSEVNLAEIYKQLLPLANPTLIDEYIQKEIAAEIKYGFLHEPSINLLKLAKEKKYKTIIVSDIYFNKTQLRHIITSLSPQVSYLIDDIYCSSEHGVGKTTGLWDKVLNQEKVPAAQLIHIGDNKAADFISPNKLGIDAIHFRHTHDEINKIFRQRESVATLIFPKLRKEAPIPNLWHSWFSENVDDETSAQKLIGWGILGPTLRCFANKIFEDYKKKNNTKIAFLMRDGFMPRLAFNILHPEIETHDVYISRLCSIRASFISKESISDHIITLFNSMDDDIAVQYVNDETLKLVSKHFGINQKDMISLKKKLSQGNYKINELIKIILSKNYTQHIINNSMQYRKKLIKHIINSTGIKAGDHLLLVDLGYEGTTQNLLQTILQEELSITISGCYMIVSYTPEWKSNRTGIVTPETFDYRTIKALTNHIAIYESLCSSHRNSTVDYTDEGIPVGEAPSISEKHLSLIREIQNEALYFIGSPTTNLAYEAEYEITSSIIDLFRFIYFPTESEIRCFSNMKFDINLGSEQISTLYNLSKHNYQMKKFGPSLLTDSNANINITNTPTELRYSGIEQSIALLSSYRYGLTWSLTDASYRKKLVDILYINNTTVVTKKLTAMYTHEGCYSLYIPIVTAEIVMKLNDKCNGIELISVSRIKTNLVYKAYNDSQMQELHINNDWFIDGADVAKGIITGLSPASILYFRPRNSRNDDVIHIVYRPIGDSCDAEINNG